MNLSPSVITFHHFENTIAQWCHGVHLFIYMLSVLLAVLTRVGVKSSEDLDSKDLIPFFPGFEILLQKKKRILDLELI